MAIQRLTAAYRSRSRPSSTPGAKASTMCPSYLDGDQALLGPEGPRERPVIPVGWQPIVAISCQLAWLCSFQGPREALRPVWAIGLSKLNSMRPPGRTRKQWPSRVPAGSAREPYGRQVRSTYLEPVELGRRGMRRRPEPALQSWSFPRKEVIQPHLPVRLPCYDFTPVTSPTFDGSLPEGLGHRLRVLLASVV